MKFVRTAAAAAAAAIAAVGLVAFVGTGGAGAATPPPYEPISFSFGTLTFYDSTGAVKTSGSVTDKPFAAYTSGSAAGRTGDHSTLLNIAQPNPSANAGNWNVDTLTGQTDYPLPSTGNPASIVTLSQSHPVSKGTTGDLSLHDFINEFPNTDPSGAGCAYSATPSGCTNASYQNLYELRLITTNGADQNTQVEVADVLVSGTTWTQVYPAPAAGPTSTTTTLGATPTSPQNAGTNVTLTATVAPSNAAGTVQFKDGTTALGSPVAVSNGTATFQSTSFAVGSHSFTAVFTPTDSTAFTGSTSTAAPYTISQTAVSTTTTLGVTPPSPITTGTKSTLTATVAPSSAAGTVQFTDGATNLGSPVTVSGGTATLADQTLSVNTHSLTAVFTPTDASAFSSSTSLAVSYEVDALPATTTTTALAVTPGMPQVFGQALPMTATVTPNNALGSVHFFDGAADIGNAPVGSGGTAQISPSTLAAGAHTLTAKFVPTNSSDFGTSTSSATQVSIDPAASGVSMTASPNGTAQKGANVTLNASVTPADATGSVQFFDGETPIGSSATVSGGAAQAIVSTLSVGTHSLTAKFSPSPANWVGSTSDAVSYEITKPPAGSSVTALSISPTSPANHGATETLTATLTPNTAAGSVEFFDGDTSLGTSTVSGGQAAKSTVLADGSHSLTAKFTSADETAFLDSTSSAVSYVVTPPATPTMTTIAATPSGPVTAGSTVSLKATINPSDAAGTVTFKDGTTALGAPVAVSSGMATISSPQLHGGTHSFSATFAPTDTTSFVGSIATPVSVTVNAVDTTTALAVTPAGPVTHGTKVTLKATVGPNGATGKVEFLSGSSSLGTAKLSGTTATLQTSALPVGTASLTAKFTATNAADFKTSTSAPVTLQVTPAAAIDAVTSGGQAVGGTAHAGETLTITASGFNANTTVTATLHSTPMTLGHATSTQQGAVQLTVTLPTTVAAGSHTLTLSDGTHTATMHLTVTTSSGVQGVGTSRGTGAGGGLADTGVNSLRGILVGIGLTALGAVSLFVGTRRYRGSHRFG